MPGCFADTIGITARYANLQTTCERSLPGIGSITPNNLPILKEEKLVNIEIVAIVLDKVTNLFLSDNRKMANVMELKVKCR